MNFLLLIMFSWCNVKDFYVGLRSNCLTTNIPRKASPYIPPFVEYFFQPILLIWQVVRELFALCWLDSFWFACKCQLLFHQLLRLWSPALFRTIENTSSKRNIMKYIWKKLTPRNYFQYLIQNVLFPWDLYVLFCSGCIVVIIVFAFYSCVCLMPCRYKIDLIFRWL